MSGFETYLLSRAVKADNHTLEGYKSNGGYIALERALKDMQPEDVTSVVKASGLRGRGGAGFPTGLKWTFMPDHTKDTRRRYLAINADESEPGTCKDRILMEDDPHGLIEGILLACYAMRCEAAYIYVRGEYRREYVRQAAAVVEAYKAGLIGKNILGSGFDCEIYMHQGAGAYICGEETGLMESLEGKRGHPRPKPPFPAGFGLWGQPTTVNNVETLFNVPFIVEKGAEWYRTMGTEASPGNILIGISGSVNKPGVYEAPLGISARELLESEEFAGGVWKGRKLKAWFTGGSSCGMVPASTIDTNMDHDSMKSIGSMLGTASMIIIDDSQCVVRASEVVARFYDHESCGQCSQCREGTQWLHQIFRRIENGRGRLEDIDMLTAIASGMAPGKTICALSDAAAIPANQVVKHFRAELEEHVRAGGCAINGTGACAHGQSATTQEVEAEA
jgi:NADH-quinone oxidoreductase subunit F